MSNQPEVTAAVFAKWKTPREAVAMLDHLALHDARTAIIKLLKYEQVNPAARTLAYNRIGSKYSRNYYRISSEWWEGLLTNSQFWESGQLERERIVLREISQHPIKAALFDVRFDPAEIAAARPPKESVPARAPPATRTPVAAQTSAPAAAPLPNPKEEIEVRRGPDVAQLHLEAWHALYKMAYTGASDTLDNAVASAKGMFPGKHVARSRVRALLGPRDPGPKPKDRSR